jgi:hypothetical protein
MTSQVVGKRSAEVKIFFDSGEVYNYSVKKSRPDEKGKMTYLNGDVYEGPFMNGFFSLEENNEYLGRKSLELVVHFSWYL